MRHLTILAALSLVLSLHLPACGSDSTKTEEDISAAEWTTLDLDEGEELLVQTEVSLKTVPAGEPVEITCKVVQDYKVVQLPSEVEVVFGETIEQIEPGVTSFEKMGTYKVACRTLDPVFVDDSPVEIEVTLGKVVKLETSIDPTEIGGGETSEATCTAFDAYGNSGLVTPGIAATPESGVSIDGQTVTGQAAGTYEIACIGEKGVEVATAELTVVPGTPAVFIATVTPDTVEAGQYAEVSCKVEDLGGNLRQADWVVQAPEEVTVAGTSIYSTVAGEHKIKCAPVNASGDEQLEPATFTVLPGVPVSMLVYPKPAKDHYTLEDQVLIKHELVDEYDNIIGDAEIEPIDVNPSGGMELTPNKTDKFLFLEEGHYQLTVNALEYPYSGQVELLCDGSGPVITITYPPRALTKTGPTNIIVTGQVEDKVSGVASLTINGDDVAVDGEGGFSYPMDLWHGMNLIDARATDGLGNEGKGFRATFYSTEYKPADASDPAAATIEEAILVFLSQEFIDDGDHSDPADDLATIIEHVVAGFDITGMLPEEGIPFMNNCTAYITNLELGKPTVTLQSVDGGMHLVVSIPDLTADIDIACCYELPFVGEYCDDYYGIIYAKEVTIDAYIFVSVTEEGTLDATLGPIEVDIVELDVDIQGLVGQLFDALVNVLVNVLKDTMVQQFADEFGEQLPEMIEEALGSLAEGEVFELPPLIGDGDPTELTLAVGFHELDFSFDGIYLAMDASLTTPKGVEHSPLGVIMRDGCMETETEPFVLSMEDEMDAAFAADFINEALYSVWYSGAITLDLTADDLADLVDLTEYGLDNLSLATDLYYAPVVQTCGTGEMMEIQVGDAFLHAKFFMMNKDWDIKLYMYIVLEITAALVEDPETGAIQVGVEVGELKVAEVDVVEVGEDLKGQEQMVDDLFAGVLIPTLMEQLTGSLGGFDIPTIDLSTLDPSIPEGTEISVDLQKLGLGNGYLQIGGKLK